jgi:phosphoribosylformylglycinamidine synthase
MDRDDSILFSESNSRFLAEVAPENQAEFEKTMAGITLAYIGQVSETGIVEVYGLHGRKVVSTSIDELKEAWQKPLRW